MLTTIKTIYGYKLAYDDRLKRFVILATTGEELAYGRTQDEAEAKAKSLTKQEFKRIPIIRVYGGNGEITAGELTSINRDEETAWVSMEKDSRTFGSGREKISLLSVKSYYEKTPPNMNIASQLAEKREAISEIRKEIGGLEEKLEKPINLAYFGLR